MKIFLKSCLLFLLISCFFQTNSQNESLQVFGDFSLELVDSMTYELPATFRPNTPFTKVFLDHDKNIEFITFGNHYVTDSLYFFDLLNGGEPVQSLSFSKVNHGNVRGI